MMAKEELDQNDDDGNNKEVAAKERTFLRARRNRKKNTNKKGGTLSGGCDENSTPGAYHIQEDDNHSSFISQKGRGRTVTTTSRSRKTDSTNPTTTSRVTTGDQQTSPSLISEKCRGRFTSGRGGGGVSISNKGDTADILEPTEESEEDQNQEEEQEDGRRPGAIPVRGMGNSGTGASASDMNGDYNGRIDNDSTNNVAELQPDLEVTPTAQILDSQELEREFVMKKSDEIRNQIISKAATAEIVEEKSLFQKYGCLCCCTLIVVALVLGLTLSKDSQEQQEQEPLVGYDYLLDLIPPISDEDILTNETTAQYDALNWLAFEDTAGIPLNESNSESLESSLLERYVLAVLYFSTGGENWTSPYNFLSNTSICEWHATTINMNDNEDGVRCNEEGFVDSISLEFNNMQGNIPSEVQALKSLQTLRLPHNGLRGTLPSSLGRMPNLRTIYLVNNALTGGIPEDFGGLLGLVTLNLGSNSLDGSLPEVVTTLARLEELLITHNNFTGHVPNFKSRGPMRRIKIFSNFFEGRLPDTMYQLSSLEELWVHSNQLEGTISSRIGNLVSLKTLTLSQNMFVGSIPAEIGRLVDLVDLYAGSNWFDHSIPTELGELGRLERLSLVDNALTGTIPSELSKLSNLQSLDLSSNLLTGSVPLELGTLETLREEGVVFLHNNSLTGSLDMSLCNENAAGLPPPSTLTADCDEIDCPCCTDCCDDITGSCRIDVGQICEGIAYNVENFLTLESWGTSCQCRDEEAEEGNGGEDSFVHLECSDSCHSCNSQGMFCLEKYNYGYDLPTSTGLDNLYECNMRYISDRNEAISYRIDWVTFECSMSINGTLCNTCLNDQICSDGFFGLFVDCSNIEADAVYDDCDQGLNGGELLQFLRPEYYEQECRNCIYY